MILAVFSLHSRCIMVASLLHSCTDEDATDEDATDEDATDEDATDEDTMNEDATDEDATDAHHPGMRVIPRCASPPDAYHPWMGITRHACECHI